MGWQTESVVQLIAGNTIINATGSFTYSAAPAAGNLVGSVTPTSGIDQFGNHYLSQISSYASGFASTLIAGGLNLWTGSLAAGWTNTVAIFVSGGQLFLEPLTGGGITLDAAGVKLTSGAALAIPQSSSGITTVNQLVVALINVGILN